MKNPELKNPLERHINQLKNNIPKLSFDKDKSFEDQKTRIFEKFSELISVPEKLTNPVPIIEYEDKSDLRFDEIRFYIESEPDFFVPAHMLLPKKIARLSLHAETAGKLARFGEPFRNRGLHRFPCFGKKLTKIRAFIPINEVRKTNFLGLADCRNLGKGGFFINMKCGSDRTPFNMDIAAANAFHTQTAQLTAAGKGDQIQGVGVGIFQNLLGKFNFCGQGGQNLPNDPVGAVTYAGFAQRAVQNDPEGICLGIPLPEQLGGPLGTHGMGGRGTFADFVDLTDGLHGNTSELYSFLNQYSKSEEKLQRVFRNKVTEKRRNHLPKSSKPLDKYAIIYSTKSGIVTNAKRGN
jgi:hypothetical protein